MSWIDTETSLDDILREMKRVKTPASLQPGLIACIAPYQFYPLTLPAGNALKVLPANPRRVAWFAWFDAAMFDPPNFTPFNPPFVVGTTTHLPGGGGSFVLRDFLSLVQAEWYGYHPAGGNIMIADLVRPPGR